MTTLVFWHGWGISPDVFTPLIAELKKLLPVGTRFQAMPLPGYDGRPLPAGNPSEVWAEAMMETLSEPVILCGWSMGAILALSAASLYPDKVEKLVLFGATPCFADKPDWNKGISHLTGSQFRSDIQNDVHRTLRHFVSLFNQRDSNARAIIRQLLVLPACPLHVLDAGLDYLAETDLRSLVPDIQQKTLLIHGAYDPLMPVDAARWLEQTLPNARLNVLPDVAHAAFLSKPAECAQLVSHFVTE